MELGKRITSSANRVGVNLPKLSAKANAGGSPVKNTAAVVGVDPDLSEVIGQLLLQAVRTSVELSAQAVSPLCVCVS